MKAIRIIAALLLCIILTVSAVPISAQDNQLKDVVITQVQTGGASSASQEYVSIYNNTDVDVDITNWCLRYNGSNTKPGCIVSTDTETRLMLKARSYTTFASNEFVTVHAGFTPQARPGFVGGMADAGGIITLVDAVGLIHDQFGWNTKSATGKIYQRINIDDRTFKDTDYDSLDFAQTTLSMPASLGLYEQAVTVDVCPNIDGQQSVMPDGYDQDNAGDCGPDLCRNISGLQTEVPSGYRQDSKSDCSAIPRESAQIIISELLPNVSGTDTGNEYIELYNPNSNPVSMVGYRIELGPTYTKSYIFDRGEIAPNAYLVIDDYTSGVVLPNTSASVRVVAPDGVMVSQTGTYENPSDDESWALINNVWQWSDQPTPGSANLPRTSAAPESIIVNGLLPCPLDKYRNPDTNRCRAAERPVKTQSCDDDEYRNPETNRCRKMGILAGQFTHCKPGQVRNPDTNRCRATVSTTTSLQSCDEGEARNPDTNRCKKSATSSANTKSRSDQPVAVSTNWPLVGAVLVMTIGYGIFEYRYDVQNMYLRLKARFARRKLTGTQ